MSDSRQTRIASVTVMRAHADQAERDHQALAAAVRSGRVEAVLGV
jgi:hypothetical protein